jgi:AbrB family looped-hinge helix DNA binding protein
MTVKVSPKYQVVIPEEVRRQANIKAGMEVTVLSKGGIVYVVPVRSLEDVARSLQGKFSPSDLKNLREKKDREL